MSRATAYQRNSHRSKVQPERYTPPHVLKTISAFLGDYHDPCPARQNAPLAANGLSQSWRDQRVYCNPPYGKPISAWVIKALTEPVEEVVMLLPAYTDAVWFAPLFEHSICFVRGRLTFDTPGNGPGGKMAAPHPSVIVYRGDRRKEFAEAFAHHGPVMETVQPYSTAPSLWEVVD